MKAVFCGVCGSLMTAYTDGYRCNNKCCSLSYGIYVPIDGVWTKVKEMPTEKSVDGWEIPSFMNKKLGEDE